MIYRKRSEGKVYSSLGVSIIAEKGEEQNSIKLKLPDSDGEIVIFQKDVENLVENYFPAIKDKYK